jgi:hypothetical protein
MKTDPFPITCPCCGYISSWGWGEICGVCDWEGEKSTRKIRRGEAAGGL